MELITENVVEEIENKYKVDGLYVISTFDRTYCPHVWFNKHGFGGTWIC